MTDVADTSRPPTASGSSSLVTFLLADVRGYTRYSAEHGDRAAAHLSEFFLSICREIVSAHDGEVFGSAGDQALAAFTSAHAAMHAALALQARLSQEQELQPDLPLRAGIGLDTGEGIRVGNDYRGNAINLAARLCSIAGGGEIFASDTVIRVARRVEGLAVVDRGEVALKGLVDPVRVVQIAQESELPDELPPLQPLLVTRPTNLPDDHTPFIGRAAEITAVAALLQEPTVRLVTLTGPGGTGKTRLALQVGNTLLHNFQDGVFFVNLAPLTDPALVPSAIAEVLGEAEEAGKDLLQSLTDSLRDRHLLLVLDNFEHVLDACAVVSSILDRCRRVRVLATSRIPLHLSREREHAVPPLAVPDPEHLPDLEALSQFEAVALFIERARAVQDTFTVTNENAPAVAEICSRLDGLPLAIELAAARIKLFPPQALLQRLSSRLKVLTGGAKDRPSRQQTLRGAIDWSYSLLTNEEQMLFARLSVFSGGCALEAAEAVCNPDEDLDLLEGMASLVDKSLVQQVGGREPRFVMLETIGEYAGEKLDARNEASAFRAAHAEYVLRMALEAEPELTGPRQGEWLTRLAGELDNIRSALNWFLEVDRADQELSLAVALNYFWHFRGYWSEGQRWLEAGLSRVDRSNSHIRGLAMLCLGQLAVEQSSHHRASELLEGALELFRGVDDRVGSARTLNGLGNLAGEMGQFEQARALYEESLLLWKETGNRLGGARALGNLGLLAQRQGNAEEAIERWEEALAIFREAGDVQNIALTLMNLSIPAQSQGRLDQALTWLEESLALFRSQAAKQRMPLCLGNLGRVTRKLGQHQRAREWLQEGLVLARELGAVTNALFIVGEIADFACERGQLERYVRLVGAEAALREQLHIANDPLSQTETAEMLATVRATMGEEAFNAAWQRGRAMSLEETMDYALEDGSPSDGDTT